MLIPGIRWISSMDVHSSGDHLIVGGYDRKLCWFDLELSEKPYKILRYVLYGIHVRLISYNNVVDIILARFDLCIFTRRIRYLRHRPTMVRFRSSTHVCTVTSSRILSSYLSRSCVGTTYAKGWACYRSDGFPSSHGWLAQGQIALLRCGATESSSCSIRQNPK